MPPVPTCGLCRVPKTEAHVASGWHRYNVRVTSEEGKTPMNEDLYLQFHAHKEEPNVTAALAGAAAAAGAASTASTVTTTASATNTTTITTNSAAAEQKKPAPKPGDSNYFFSETDLFPMAKDILTKALLATHIPVKDGVGSMTISEVNDISGSCSRTFVRRKRMIMYELKATISWKGAVLDGDDKPVVEATGSATIADISPGMDEDDYELVDIKLTGKDTDTNGHRLLQTFFRKAGKPALQKAVHTFVSMLQDEVDKMEKAATQ